MAEKATIISGVGVDHKIPNDTCKIAEAMEYCAIAEKKEVLFLF